MIRHAKFSLYLSLALGLSCNSDNRLVDTSQCDPSQQDCSTTPTKTPPPGGGPNTVAKLGPGTSTPFDPGDDGSTGVKKDPTGNIVIDPNGLGGSQTPILWVANSEEGTVSKIDTRKMMEIGRYYTYPGGGADPSRSTVSLSGDVVVANRCLNNCISPDRASAVYIAASLAGCEDRNHNGKIDTSLNTTPGQAAVPLPWTDEKNPQDECIRWLTHLPASSLPRAAGFNAAFGESDTFVYVGLNAIAKLVRIKASDGTILKTIDLNVDGQPPVQPYGLVLDKGGNVWIRGMEGSLAKVDPNNNDKITIYNASNGLAPPCPYGIAADSMGRIYTSGPGATACVSRFDPVALKWEVLDLSAAGAQFPRGLAVDNTFHVWVSDGAGGPNTGMFHVDASGPTMKLVGKTAAVAAANTGAAIDFDNNPWMISQTNSMAYKVDRTNHSLQGVPTGTHPYTYSDMTGYQLRNAGAVSGLWRHTFVGCGGGQATQWYDLNWQLQAPHATQVTVRVRFAKDQASLANAMWMQSAMVPPDMPPIHLKSPGDGSLMEVEFDLKSADQKITPILSGISASFSCVVG